LLFGKATMLAWIGRRITKYFGDGPLCHPVVAVLIGGAIVLVLYTVPVLGFVLSKLIAWLGLGVVVYTLIQGSKRNRSAGLAAASAVPATSVGPAVIDVAPAGGTGTIPPVGSSSIEPPVIGATALVTGAPSVVSAAALQRAGFWIRIAASFLDAILVGFALSLIPHRFNEWKPHFLLVYATYCIVLWALRGSTVGGIICSLKVVRLDDRPLDWPTALVRGLAGFLSLIAAGLGFIWVAFDDQRQSWHDKIAGTTIVHVPKGVSLV
jgi:uncharacterized RDD family membrane protein YckC